MKERNAEDRPFLEFDCMDARKVDLPDEVIDLVIEKSTLDTILCGKKAFIGAARMIREI